MNDFSVDLWGGVECTVNRIGDRYRDQLKLTGHHDRKDDLARIAGLGIRKIRYPVLWERVSPDSHGEYDWRWSDERIGEFCKLGLTPIIGLLHHGSGPSYTSLTSPEFAQLFSEYAGAVAERYPHVRDWTPINEPLTTARFSTLYGHWFPHSQDEGEFWTALLNQIDATRLAMAAIRHVIPDARLVQTEDIGQVYSTETTAPIAAFYNDRRWMTWDLLTGAVGTDHPLWRHLAGYGLESRLEAIAASPCPPDVVGINHYVTSHRFLDDTPQPGDRLPAVGYDDVVAVRKLADPPMGIGQICEQVWQRYTIPIAVTEAHLACTREEQLRWLWQNWEECGAVVRTGVQIEAVCAWAMFGAVDWCSLLTKDKGKYQPGLFDVSGASPRPTALADLASDIANGSTNPVRRELAAQPGWWQRDVRFAFTSEPYHGRHKAAVPLSGKPILITGATGTLGRALAGSCELRGLAHVVTDRDTMAIDDAASVARALDELQPWAVINAAGWVRVDDAEDAEAECFNANFHGAAIVANACRARNIHCTLFSGDLVFGAQRHEPYCEDDRPSPLSAYGRSKAAAEDFVRDNCPNTLVIRTAAFFSPFDQQNFAFALEQTLRGGREFGASDAYIVTPAYVPDLVNAVLDLIVDQETGIWHLTSQDAVSWFEFGRLLAGALDLDVSKIRSASPSELGWLAERPRFAALGSTRGRLMPPLADAVSRYVSERQAQIERAASLATLERLAA